MHVKSSDSRLLTSRPTNSLQLCQKLSKFQNTVDCWEENDNTSTTFVSCKLHSNTQINKIIKLIKIIEYTIEFTFSKIITVKCARYKQTMPECCPRLCQGVDCHASPIISCTLILAKCTMDYSMSFSYVDNYPHGERVTVAHKGCNQCQCRL